jgi:transposase-like protein
MQGRHSAIRITLTPDEHATLQHWLRQTVRIHAAWQRRARLILLLAQGVRPTQVARLVGINRRHIYKWVHRFEATRIEALKTMSGRTRRRTQE